MSELQVLFQPLQIGPISAANRLMMSGMSAGSKVDERGEISPQMIAYYLERARGAPGMIAVGAAAVVPPPQASAARLGSSGIRLYSDEMIPSLAKLVREVQKHGSRFGIQLYNGGGTERGTAPIISPSGISSNVREARTGVRRRLDLINRPLPTEEIAQVVEYFAAAAERCRQAGFDFVEVHAGHGYLISNFLTPLFNRRTDQYGGTLQNRARFLLEIVESVKRRVGNAIAVGVKFNGDDFIGSDGWQLQDSVQLAPMLESAGADYLTVTAGLIGADRLTIPPMYEQQGCYAHLASAVKAQVKIPVGTVGRIKDPLMARDIVSRGDADFVVLGRAFIADPEFAGKVRAGRLSDIRPCLADCRGCADEHIQRGGQTSCVVNPRMCRELDLQDIEGDCSATPKKVLVVGGGLAGLEAARRTAFSGHRVTLCEASSQLGGQIVLARQMPGRNELGDILPWYERQLQKHSVSVRLGTRVDKAFLEEFRPDAVIVATGSVPQVPQDMVETVMGADGISVHLLDDMIDRIGTEDRRVLVVGGNQNGLVAADWLAEHGREVWIAERSNHFGQKLAGHDRWYLFNRMGGRPIHRIKGVTSVTTENKQVTLHTAETEHRLGEVDAIVFADERKADRSVAEAARSLGIEAYLVGEAFDSASEHAGTIFASIAQAYDVARSIR